MNKIYIYLTTIPKGKVVTYGQIAEHLGNKRLARAEGNDMVRVNCWEEAYKAVTEL